MQSVVAQFPGSISFFVRPSSLEELERRLRGRGTESEETIQRRLEVARHEWQFRDRYRYDIVNDSIQHTALTMCELLRSEAQNA
jgi:guanylate kinase